MEFTFEGGFDWSGCSSGVFMVFWGQADQLWCNGNGNALYRNQQENLPGMSLMDQVDNFLKGLQQV